VRVRLAIFSSLWLSVMQVEPVQYLTNGGIQIKVHGHQVNVIKKCVVFDNFCTRRN
jgi:hypothetical protein